MNNGGAAMSRKAQLQGRNRATTGPQQARNMAAIDDYNHLAKIEAVIILFVT